MRILFVAPRYHTNQIPIVEGLVKEGNRVYFWSQFTGLIEEHRAVKPVIMRKSVLTTITSAIRHAILPGGAAELEDMKKFIPSPVWILIMLMKLKPDLVITREKNRVSRVVSICCKIIGIKNVILYIQDPYFHKYEKQSIRQKIKSKILPKVIYTPVKYDTSNKCMDYHDRHSYHVPLVYTIENKISPIHAEYMANGELRLLDIGKYRGYKYHFGAIEAFKLLSQDQNVSLTIIGQCKSEDEIEYKAKLLSKIQEYNLEDRIRLLDNVPYSEMANIYKDYDMLLLPSKSESAGMVILEAMGNGMGVICTRTCGLAYCVEESGCGDIYTYDDPEELAKIVSKYASAPSLVRECANKAYSYIAENCSFENYRCSLNELICSEFK